MRRLRLPIALFFALIGCALQAPLLSQQTPSKKPAPPKPDPETVTRGRAILKTAYEDIKSYYYDPKFHGITLDATYHTIDEQMKHVTTNPDAFRLIASFLFALKDTHTFFMPPGYAEKIERDFEMTVIGDKCFITRVESSTAKPPDMHVGDQVLLINGFKVNRESLDHIQYYYNLLNPQPNLELVLQSPSGERHTVISHARIRAGNLERPTTRHRREQEGPKAQANAAQVVDVGKLSIFELHSFSLAPEAVDELFDHLKTQDSLIVDLRGNPGGYLDVLKNILGHVLDRDVKLGDRIARNDTKPEIAKTIHKHNFTGKIIVLTDSESGSSSEVFARVIQLEHRGAVLGDRSAGAVMEARHYDESFGIAGVVPYAFSITFANLVMTDGNSLENTGVVPDELILTSAADLAARKDPVLARAAEIAGITLTPEKAAGLFTRERAVQ